MIALHYSPFPSSTLSLSVLVRLIDAFYLVEGIFFQDTGNEILVVAIVKIWTCLWYVYHMMNEIRGESLDKFDSLINQQKGNNCRPITLV